MHPPIGFKTAEPAYTDGIVDRFYRPLIGAGIAPVIMSIDGAAEYPVRAVVPWPMQNPTYYQLIIEQTQL